MVQLKTIPFKLHLISKLFTRRDTSKRPILTSFANVSICTPGGQRSQFKQHINCIVRSGQISTMDELTVIMRSLGMSPTITELKSYMRDKGGKISFADFLEIMHGHSKKESIPRELLEAFRGMDPQRKGYIPAKVVEYKIQALC